MQDRLPPSRIAAAQAAGPASRPWRFLADLAREDRLLSSRVIAACGFAVFLMLFGLELLDPDEKTAGELVRDAIELGIAVGGTTLLALFLGTRLTRQETRLGDLEGDLERARAEGDPWRQTMRPHIEALASAVQTQFKEWHLTEAEQDIGFLLLKGLSFKEIAILRRTNEGTVRQQATSLYRKSRLEGRTALAAYFFEDLLTPIPAETPARPPGSGPTRVGRASSGT